MAACANAPTPSDSSALLQAGEWGRVYRGGYLEVASVGGAPASWRLRSDVALAPGEHTALVYVFLCEQSMKHCRSVAQTELRFRALSGHTYRLMAQEQGHGSNRFSVWLTDVATGERIATAVSA
jgi:hypothetical protein